MMVQEFSIARLPAIEFGSGAIKRLPGILAGFGRKALFVIGRKSVAIRPVWAALQDQLAGQGIECTVVVRESGEPTPEEVDNIAAAHRDRDFAAVVGIGGGSTLDAAKAVAGLLRVDHSVMDFLEGVGPELPYRGPSVPFIAVPTTAGTGTEATKNAVLSRSGRDGFKKSFRDEALVAQWAIVDPDLVEGCPPEILAGDGMDALTQLLESYLSKRANPLTDALALSGLAAVRDGLEALVTTKGAAAHAREKMAYASLLSGICLAQTGLGAVHGLAGPLGALFPIPHGLVCGTLVAAVTRENLAAMAVQPDVYQDARLKYAKAAQALGIKARGALEEEAQALVACLQQWTDRFAMPKLSAYGVTAADFPDLIAAARKQSSMKTNPVTLSDAALANILKDRL